MQKFSLHTHTLGFDGQNTEKEMLAKAQELGWTHIGFSNHFIVHPNITESPMYAFAVKGINPEDLFGYVALPDYGITAAEVEKLARKFAEHFNFPHEITDDDISSFFGKQDWKTLTVNMFSDCCIDMVVYKQLEDM